MLEPDGSPLQEFLNGEGVKHVANGCAWNENDYYPRSVTMEVASTEGLVKVGDFCRVGDVCIVASVGDRSIGLLFIGRAIRESEQHGEL